MALPTFENAMGEGVVSFQRSTLGVASTFYSYLLLDGERIFEFGSSCGTCGIVFRKIGSPSHRVDDAEAVELMGSLERVPPPVVLQRLARPLEVGHYFPVVVEGRVFLIEPGSADDYFATDVARLFGEMPPEELPQPATGYYRFASEHSIERSGRTGGPHTALLTALVMPLISPALLDRARVELWKERQRAGQSLTAFAVAVIDDQEPWGFPVDRTYPYEEQLLFANCLLDGHHRIQAAAETHAPIRILSLVARDVSITKDAPTLAAVLNTYSLSSRECSTAGVASGHALTVVHRAESPGV